MRPLSACRSSPPYDQLEAGVEFKGNIQNRCFKFIRYSKSLFESWTRSKIFNKISVNFCRKFDKSEICEKFPEFYLILKFLQTDESFIDEISCKI